MALEQPSLITSPFNGKNPFAADIPGIDALPSEKDYRTIGWCEDALVEGSTFLKSQEGYDRIERSIKIIIGEGSGASAGIGSKNPSSQTRTNRVAKVAEDVAAILTDTKPFWEYQTANRRFEQHATIYGKLATGWYQNHNVAMRLSDVIKYALAAGTGFAHLVWNEQMQDIDFVAEDPRNVIPIRPNGYDSCQNALGMLVQKWYSVNYFKQKYGIDVKAESDASASQAQMPGGGLMGYLKNTVGASQPKPPKFPVAALKILYLTDTRKNPKQSAVAMGSFDNGKEANNWSYIVEPGDMLYPNKRMIVWVGQHLIYDGPSHYWHGQFPLIKFTLSPWPWSWLGKGVIWDLLPLNDSLNSTLRIIDDHLAQVRNPGAVMDKNSVSRSQFDSFDTSRPGWKAYQNPLAGKGIQVIPPPPLDASVTSHRDWLQTELRELGGVTDFSQMAHLNQLPSNDTVDSILNSMTPMNRYRSRIIEAFVGGSDGLAMQLAYNFSQYYTLPMRCQILGSGGIVVEDFDYDPKSLIPAYPHDHDVDSTGSPVSAALARGPLPRYHRAQEFMKRFTFKIAPSSFLNSAQVQDQMMKFQLFRAGVLDIWTLMEALGIPNMGVLPDNVRTIPERIAYQNQIGLVPIVSPTGRKASGQEAPRQTIKES